MAHSDAGVNNSRKRLPVGQHFFQDGAAKLLGVPWLNLAFKQGKSRDHGGGSSVRGWERAVMRGGPGERQCNGTTAAPIHKAIISQRLRAGRNGDSTPRLLRLLLHRAFNI